MLVYIRSLYSKSYLRLCFPVYKKVMTFVLLVTLAIGQSFAYEYSPCPMEDMMEDMMEMSMDMPDDCCDGDCECPEGTFSSVTLLSESFAVPSLSLSQFIVTPATSYLSAVVPQDYKPPISL